MKFDYSFRYIASQYYRDVKDSLTEEQRTAITALIDRHCDKDYPNLNEAIRYYTSRVYAIICDSNPRFTKNNEYVSRWYIDAILDHCYTVLSERVIAHDNTSNYLRCMGKSEALIELSKCEHVHRSYTDKLLSYMDSLQLYMPVKFTNEVHRSIRELLRIWVNMVNYNDQMRERKLGIS